MVNEPVFGWGSPKLAEQYPSCDADVLLVLQKDCDALVRLSSRGVVVSECKIEAERRLAEHIIETVTEDLAR